MAYYITLNGAYQHGELGTTYPIMRGFAPLLVALSGTFETLPLIEATRKAMTVAFAADAAGM